MDDKYKMLLGDCIDTMKTLDADSVDSIVTDPPYGLEFMGKNWDGAVPGVPFWKEALRVAKPGAHILAFGGTRTFHRLAVAIEDAGWEIRDTVMWVYGSGFPKSHNLKGEWEGWGTALKPAWEPVIVARKPLIGTVAENVLRYGTGAMNIDKTRVAMGDEYDPTKVQRQQNSSGAIKGAFGASALIGKEIQTYKPGGRWPANVVHDGSEEVTELFPIDKPKKMVRNRTAGARMFNNDGKDTGYETVESLDDPGGSTARFFYCSKTNKKDRGDGNIHPTVKPTDLMRYLCRLVTPPKGIVLDPFMGSGSTGKAAMLEGFRFIGCEMNKEYMDIAERRIKEAADSKGLGDLFDD